MIDDEPSIRDLLDTLLTRRASDSGQKGLEIYCRARVDVIVLDLKMPGMDGLAVLQQVHQLNPTQPVVMLTGAGIPEAEQRTRALGVTEYVEKAFSLHLLGDMLRRLSLSVFSMSCSSTVAELSCLISFDRSFS